MNFFISSDFRTSTSALIPSLFSLPSFTVDDVDIFFNCIGIGGFYGQGVVGCVQACFQGVVSVDYGKVKVRKASGNLLCRQLYKFDFVRVFLDVVYGCGDACSVIEGDQALFLEKEKRSGFIGRIVGNCNFSAISDSCKVALLSGIYSQGFVVDIPAFTRCVPFSSL